LRAIERYLAARASGSAGAAEDALAWEWFHRTYDPAIRRLVRRAGLSPTDTDDCVQEAWAELLGALAAFAFDPRLGRFEAWLRVLVRRKIIQFYRRRGRELVRPASDSVARAVSDGDDPTAHFQRQEERALVRRVLSLLRPEISEINYRLLQLRWVQGREIPAIAETLDLTAEQVRYRLHRLKRRIRVLVAREQAHRALVA
jgi:RNA polymerase sigma factor (sigma-70 family)